MEAVEVVELNHAEEFTQADFVVLVAASVAAGMFGIGHVDTIPSFRQAPRSGGSHFLSVGIYPAGVKTPL